MICGIDIAKGSFHAACRTAKEPFVDRPFPNTRQGFRDLVKWAQHSTGCSNPAFGMEATGRYHQPLARYLHAQGHTVYVANPLMIKRYTQSLHLRAKTDRIDAVAICRFFMQEPCPVQPYQPPSEAHLRLVELWRCRIQLIELRTVEKNRISEGSLIPTVYEIHRQVIQDLSVQIHFIEEQLKDLITRDPEFKESFKLLRSIPGFGPWTSIALLAERPSEAMEPRSAAQHFGLAAQPRTSGTSVRGVARCSKDSSRRLRPYLFMGARSAVRLPYAPFRLFLDDLLARGKHYMVAMVAVMRKMLVTAIGVLRNKTPFDPNIVNKYRLKNA